MVAIVSDCTGVPDQPSDEEVLSALDVLDHENQFNERGRPNEKFASALEVVSRRQAFIGIYEGLMSAGAKLPEQPAKEISSEALEQHIREQVCVLLSSELRSDPEDVYPNEDIEAAETGDVAAADRLAHLINTEFAWEQTKTGEWRSRPADSGDHRRELEPSPAKPLAARAVSHPIARFLKGFPHAPTVFSADDVVTALRLGVNRGQ